MTKLTTLLLAGLPLTAALAQRGVGIGTTNPRAQLHVESTSASQPHLLLRNPLGGSGAAVNLDFQTYDPGANPSGVRLQAVDNNYSADLLFWTKQPGALANPLVERLRLTNDGRLGLGTVPDASAVLDLAASNRGVLLPRLLEQARLALASPAPGLLVFQTDGMQPGFWYNAGTAAAPAWARLTDGNGVSYAPGSGLQVGPVLAPASGTVGSPTTTATGGSPFGGSSASHQVGSYYPAAQLAAAGMVAGRPLTSLGWTVTTKASAAGAVFTSFTIQVANLATEPTTTALPTGLTTVYSGGVTTTTGANVLPLSAPFAWDGSSGLYVLTCFSNAAAPGVDAVAADAGSHRRADGSASVCGAAMQASGPVLPNLLFTQGGSYTLPATGGTAGQVLTQQANGSVAFQDPASPWVQAGNTLYPKNLASRVGIGTATPDAAAVLDVASASQGVLLPRFGYAARAALGANPPAGLIFFNTDANQLNVYGGPGVGWQTLATADASVLQYSAPGLHTYTVPAGVKQVRLEVAGAQGGGTRGGGGAVLAGDLAVSPGQVLYLLVGGTNGLNGDPGISRSGGLSADYQGNPAGPYAGNGGGASEVRVGTAGQVPRRSAAVLIAGGGGGSGGSYNADPNKPNTNTAAAGGDSSGPIDLAGSNGRTEVGSILTPGGGAATTREGSASNGAGSQAGQSNGQGGSAQASADDLARGVGGGGGGGGYYAGGSGGTATETSSGNTRYYGSGGGGGSSFITPASSTSALSGASSSNDNNNGNGYITITPIR